MNVAKPGAQRVHDSEARKKAKGLSKAWEWGYWKQFPKDREKLRKYAERLRKRQERDLSG